MAQAAAVLGSAVAGVTVDDVDSTSKTFPDFPRVWSALLDAR
jgi:3-phosphoshikimate 1-carboxyvinyltransferase